MFTSSADHGIELSRRAAKDHELFEAAAERTRTQRRTAATAPSSHPTPAYRVALARTLVGLARRLDPA